MADDDTFVQVTLAHTLPMSSSTAIGLDPGAYKPGDTITVSLTQAYRLVSAGLTTINPTDRATLSLLAGSGSPTPPAVSLPVFISDVEPENALGPYFWVQSGLPDGQSAVWIRTGEEGEAAKPLVAGDLTRVDVQTVTGAKNLTPDMLPLTCRWLLSGNLTLALSGVFPSAQSGHITLRLKQAAAGGPFTVTFPAAIEWPNDALAPVMPTVAGAELLVHLFWDGVGWFGSNAGPYFR